MCSRLNEENLLLAVSQSSSNARPNEADPSPLRHQTYIKNDTRLALRLASNNLIRRCRCRIALHT